jgi:hypothetical protein
MKIQPFTSTDLDGTTFRIRVPLSKRAVAGTTCRECGYFSEVVLSPDDVLALRDWLKGYLEEVGEPK